VSEVFDELDRLLFLDSTSELAVDRKAFIKFISHEDSIPKDLRDITLVETSKYLGRRIKERGSGRPISWRDGERYGLSGHPLSEQDIRALGVTERTSTDELASILTKEFPEIPSFWMNSDSKQLMAGVFENFRVNRTVWDCVVANLGWWAAITLAGGLVILAILVGSGVPWPWALLIAGIYQAAATAYFLFQCIANPNFQQ
jgi:hypothetical protein